MRRNERRALRVREEIAIEAVLASYGYRVQHSHDRREQQFSCDLHGDGQDTKPSARCYPESNQWYCWACSASRDAIGTVREKEGLGFGAALDLLEARYRLPPLPWDDDDDRTETAPNPLAELEGALARPHTTPDQEMGRLKSLLAAATAERTYPAALEAHYWEFYDYLRSLLVGGAAEAWEEGLYELRLALISARG